jgi:DNA mismatch endonuclease, patch repair protein
MRHMSDILHSSGSSSADFTAEQDQAAGGRDARKVRLKDSSETLASVRLQQQTKKGNYVYAHLRYRAYGETRTRYIGRIKGSTRAEALATAWRIVHDKDLLNPSANR